MLRLLRRRQRRGSTLLIVLALLSVLVLLATTLAFTSRLEAISSKNYARAIQNRTAALTGVEAAAFAASLKLPTGAIGAQDLAQVGSMTGKSDAAPSPLRTRTATYKLSDASSKVNLNTANEAQLTRYFTAVSEESGVPVDAAALAQEIVSWRLGPDAAPGEAGVDDNRSKRFETSDDDTTAAKDAEIIPASTRSSAACLPPSGTVRQKLAKAIETGIDEADEYVSDLRALPFGDDRRFQNVSELGTFQGVSEQFLAAAAPGLTVFSVSYEARPGVGDNTETDDSLIDLNRATAQEIYEALVDRYAGAKDDNLLRQFAVNIVDARDTDSIPTSMEGTTAGTSVLGTERSPVLTEVLPVKPVGGSRRTGEFVEIYNPWSTSVDLAGWSLRAAGRTVPLSGSIQPQATLIVTDDFDNSADESHGEELAGEGSFYDIFGVASNGAGNHILEAPALELPSAKGPQRVDLVDAEGNLIDTFAYTIKKDEPRLRSSYQRTNPIVRESQLLAATPFTRPPAEKEALDLSDKLRSLPQDAPFTSLGQLFDVFAGFAAAEGKVSKRWSFPLPAAENSDYAKFKDAFLSTDQLDARIVDVFSIEATVRPTMKSLRADRTQDMEKSLALGPNPWADGLSAQAGDPAVEKDAQALQALALSRWNQAPRGMNYGLININTADRAVLISLGLEPNQADRILDRRKKLEAEAIADGGAPGVLYEHLSDVLGDDDLWGRNGDSCSRVTGFDRVAGLVATGSRAFILEGQALVAAEEGTPQGVWALLAFDREQPELVSWRYAP